MGKIFSEDRKLKKPRIPQAVNGIQINFCKNPRCANFGVPAREEPLKRGRPGKDSNKNTQDNYTLTGTRKEHGTQVLKCRSCGEHPPVKSNRGIAEELERISGYLTPPPEPSCKATDCENHDKGVVSHPEAYALFGTSQAGSKRYQCKACKKTFSIKTKSTHRQRMPHKNKQIFRSLVNKVPFRGICEIAEINPKTLYDKIDFIHRQCLRFAADRERRLLNGLSVGGKYQELRLSTDRQEYIVNWTQRKDKRNVRLLGIGTADNRSGYVFAMNLNFDPALSQPAIEAQAAITGDCHQKPAFRDLARIWLQCDYKNAKTRQAIRRTAKPSLIEEITETYEEVLLREDVEKVDSMTHEIKLPSNGMQIHAEYTMYAHFRLLKQLLSGVKNLRFFLDQDSGIRAACLSAFTNKIKQGDVDAFYVRIAKDLTVDEKRRLKREADDRFSAMAGQFPDLSEREIELELIKERMRQLVDIGQWKDRWLLHPHPSMTEPEKAVCHLTDIGQHDDATLANFYRFASLNAIDRFFMQVRRMLSPLERPIGASSRAARMWYGYSAYNPEVVVKLLDIFRVYYNFIGRSEIKVTPAMNLGLAKGKVSIEDIIYY